MIQINWVMSSELYLRWLPFKYLFSTFNSHCSTLTICTSITKVHIKSKGPRRVVVNLKLNDHSVISIIVSLSIVMKKERARWVGQVMKKYFKFLAPAKKSVEDVRKGEAFAHCKMFTWSALANVHKRDGNIWLLLF